MKRNVIICIGKFQKNFRMSHDPVLSPGFDTEEGETIKSDELKRIPVLQPGPKSANQDIPEILRPKTPEPDAPQPAPTAAAPQGTRPFQSITFLEPVYQHWP